MKQTNRREKLKKLALPAFSLVAGFFNGFIGAGGGVVMMLALLCLRRLSSQKEKNAEFAGTGAAVMVFSIVSSAVYAFTGRVEWSLALPMIPIAAIGGAIGGGLLKKIDPTALRLLFSLLVFYSGITAVLKR